MIKFKDIWPELLAGEQIILKVSKKSIPSVKRKISSYKHRKAQELEENLGRLHFRIVDGTDEDQDRLKRGEVLLKIILEPPEKEEVGIPAAIFKVGKEYRHQEEEDWEEWEEGDQIEVEDEVEEEDKRNVA